MLEMHLELAQLRKNCLEETTSPDVVNKVSQNNFWTFIIFFCAAVTISKLYLIYYARFDVKH